MTPKLLMIGLSCLDHSWYIEQFPPTQSRTRASAYKCQGGGPAATAAATAARLGASVDLWAIHGDDANGAVASQELSAFGVNTKNILVPKNAQTIVSGILVNPSGERYIFPYLGHNLRDSSESINLDSLRNSLQDCGCVLTDSRHPVINEVVLQEAKRLNIPIVGDFGNTENWHLTSYVDYLIVSEECASQLLKRSNPEAALEVLRQFEGQFVGITLGEEGFLYQYKNTFGTYELRHIPAFPVEVLDTTGAGDVFHGAFAFGIASNWGIHDCGLFASVTAALSCTKLGGRAGIPSLPEVKALLEEQNFGES